MSNSRSVKIFKFGGASIKDAAGIQNVARIVQKYQNERPVLVVSAAGKTTNMLEAVARAYYHQTGQAEEKLRLVKDYHRELMLPLFDDPQDPIYDEIHDQWVDIEWLLEEAPREDFDYLYDQIVSVGELLSTRIVAAYFNRIGLTARWLDVRDCILTDNEYRDAGIHWAETEANINRIVPVLRSEGLVLTQGFIGGTSENFTTTLGREGSDYTAAIFAYCLNAQSLTIWKDVPGVLSADPRRFDDAVLLPQVSYSEAIEMTYYGAQVIHPKTLRPLQSKGIPLEVRSFVDSDRGGTLVSAQDPEGGYPLVRVVKPNQALIELRSRDFYFVDEARFGRLFAALAAHRIKVNMTQNTALSFSICVDNQPERLEAFLKAAQDEYETECSTGLCLLTLRHGRAADTELYKSGRTIRLEEQISRTVQLVFDEEEMP